MSCDTSVLGPSFCWCASGDGWKSAVWSWCPSHQHLLFLESCAEDIFEWWTGVSIFLFNVLLMQECFTWPVIDFCFASQQLASVVTSVSVVLWGSPLDMAVWSICNSLNIHFEQSLSIVKCCRSKVNCQKTHAGQKRLAGSCLMSSVYVPILTDDQGPALRHVTAVKTCKIF